MTRTEDSLFPSVSLETKYLPINLAYFLCNRKLKSCFDRRCVWRVLKKETKRWHELWYFLEYFFVNRRNIYTHENINVARGFHIRKSCWNFGSLYWPKNLHMLCIICIKSRYSWIISLVNIIFYFYNKLDEKLYRRIILVKFVLMFTARYF